MTYVDYDRICKCIDEISVTTPTYPRWSIKIGDDWEHVPIGEQDMLKAKINAIIKEDYERGVSLWIETDETCNGLHHICEILEEEEEEEGQYPTIEEILAKMKELKEDENEWDDDTIYDAICEWDDKFADDPDWFDEEDTDVKDRLRDDVAVHLGWDVK